MESLSHLSSLVLHNGSAGCTGGDAAVGTIVGDTVVNGVGASDGRVEGFVVVGIVGAFVGCATGMWVGFAVGTPVK